MKYSDLITQLSEKTGQSEDETKDRVERALVVLESKLEEGKSVSIPDLGTFEVKVKEEKKVYNPHYNSYMIVPPKRVVEFTPASGLKEKMKFLRINNE
ncbi:MAG: HU family DNA-binding protein [Bacteroidetes bacterium]|jgi:nucleoid DNA-binding protein|nr:HU family DNA-binding protein [Bacteroidota bacterium]